MSQPQSPVDVCNIALDHLGQTPVTSITDNSTPHGAMLGRHYDMVRRALLYQFILNFSKRRAMISRVDRTPAFDFTDAYLLPRDNIRILNFGGPPAASVSVGQPPTLGNNLVSVYDIEDDENGSTNIVLNNSGAATLALRYIADIQDVTKFNPQFVVVLAIATALSVAFRVTKNKEDVSRLNELLKIELPALASISGQENPPTRIENSRFLNARMRNLSEGVAGPYTIFPSFPSNWT